MERDELEHPSTVESERLAEERERDAAAEREAPEVEEETPVTPPDFVEGPPGFRG